MSTAPPIGGIVGRSRPGGTEARDHLRLAGWTVLIGPTTVLAHEVAHWIVGLALGYDVTLGAASVTGGPRLGISPGHHVALQAGAGPTVSAALTLFAIMRLQRTRTAGWALALAALAPLRFLVALAALVTDMVVAVVGGTRGWPNFDEANLAAALGLPGPPLFIAVTALLFWAWHRVWTHLPGRRWPSLAVLITAAAFGLILWLLFLGPIVVALFN